MCQLYDPLEDAQYAHNEWYTDTESHVNYKLVHKDEFGLKNESL